MKTIDRRRWEMLTALTALNTAMGAAAAPVALDISASFNYDAVGTVGEHRFTGYYRFTNVWTGLPTYPVTNASTIYHTMLGTWSVALTHSVGQFENNGRCFASQALADLAGGTGKTGLPPSYVVGDFELAKGVVPPEGYDRYGRTNWVFTSWPDVTNTYPVCVSNSLRMLRTTNVLDLVPYQQQAYSSFNILFTGWRAVGAGTYTARIEAKYSGMGGAWTTVWEDVKTVASGTTNAGGSFATGGATGGAEGTWEDVDGVDTNLFGNVPYVSVKPVPAHVSTRCVLNQGSPAYNGLSTANRYLWTWDSNTNAPGNQGVPLDPKKTLQAFRFTCMSSSSTLANRLQLFAISAEPAPPGNGTILLLR